MIFTGNGNKIEMAKEQEEERRSIRKMAEKQLWRSSEPQ